MLTWWPETPARRGSEQGSPRIEVEDVENDLGTHQDAEARDVPSAEAARDAVEAPVGLSSEVQSQEGRGDHTRLGEMQRVLHTVEYDLKHRLERERTALREAAAARDHVQKLQNGLDDAEYRLDQQYAKYADKQKELIYLKGDKTKLQGEHDELLQKWDSQAAEIHSQTRTIGQNKKIISRQADELGNLHDEISARNDELVALCSDLKQARESLLREKARAAELSCDLSLLRKKLKYGGMKKDQLLALIEGLNLPSQSPRATKAELISLILDNEVVEEDGQSR